MIQKIYKFGGASVKDADAVRNLTNIVKQHKDEDILLVVSAMGKTTNMLEKVLADFRQHNGELGFGALSEVMEYHERIILDLFDNKQDHPVIESVSNLFIELYEKLSQPDLDYDYQYDQTVSYGELLSTTIIQEYLNHCDVPARWLDARKYVLTDYRFRAANPDWDETRLKIQKLNDEHIRGIVCITQGFIGGTADGKHSVTLGREGSDYTAAIFANCLDAEEVTIWKDVDGLLNADPKRFANTIKIPHISYSEAIELAFYGATIIHPKTIKPLQNKNITLKVQSFLHPECGPTIIDNNSVSEDHSQLSTSHSPLFTPHYIVKDNQTLVSISPRDFSFMNEHNLQIIFATCDELHIHANMMQTSALMLSFCFDHNDTKCQSLIATLRDDFSIKYNDGLQLFTIRHYTEGIETDFIAGRKVFLEQRSRTTAQFIISGS
ncbi:MAG: aspartate kinase [Bacteroidales bacterium]|nr:aspartate kinase [Bacteroidales bacterium]